MKRRTSQCSIDSRHRTVLSIVSSETVRTPNPAALLQRNTRRPGEEMSAEGQTDVCLETTLHPHLFSSAIPTIPTDDADELTETLAQVPTTVPTYVVRAGAVAASRALLS